MARFTPTFSALILAIFLVREATATGFLRSGLVDKTDVTKAFLVELASTADQDRLTMLEDSLRQTYRSLPKNAAGNLGHQAVRYILHRLFVQQHGWYVGGLEPKNGTDGTRAKATNNESRKATDKEWSGELASVTTREEWVPSFLQELLENRLGDRGTNLHDLAILAASIEDLVGQESMGRLRTAYELYGRGVEEAIPGSLARDVSMTYLMTYLLAGNLSANGIFEMHLKQEVFAQRYPGWKDVKVWLDELLERHLSSDPNATVDFATVTSIANDIGSSFYTFNDLECRSLKSTLQGLEGGKAGRVRLSIFYKTGLYSHWRFTEKADYLRVLGALDESDPTQPRVIVPNYIMARTNCLEASNLYAVCCRNECEDLMGHLESKIGEESARPERILELTAALPSDTVKAPRNISASLVERLQQVAANHGGRVPLHGRLFAQWMHHAYPRECPYPHEAGTTNPLTPEDWMKETGQTESVLSESEMMLHVQNDQCASDAPHSPGCSEDMELPWSENEELLLVHPQPAAGAQATAGAGAHWYREVALTAAGLVCLSLFLALEHSGAAQHHKEDRGPLPSVAQPRASLARWVTLPLSLLALAAYAPDLLRGPALASAFCVGLALMAAAQAASARASKLQDSADAELPF